MVELNFEESKFKIYPKVKLNIPYSIYRGKILKLNIIVPVLNSKKHYPLIICAGKINLAILISLSNLGFVVAQVKQNNVLSIKSATHYLISHAYKYKIDSYRYYLWGIGKSAKSAVKVIMTLKNQAFSVEDIRLRPLHFKACLISYGNYPTNISFPSNKIPPFLLIHGTEDKKMPFNKVKQFYKSLLERQIPVTLFKLINANHGGNDFYTPYILEKVKIFINQAT